jgi:hypothetical protein
MEPKMVIIIINVDVYYALRVKENMIDFGCAKNGV